MDQGHARHVPVEILREHCRYDRLGNGLVQRVYNFGLRLS